MAVFTKHGVKTWGMEGPWAPEGGLPISVSHFCATEAGRLVSAPRIPVDVVLCLEMAEHIEPSNADLFMVCQGMPNTGVTWAPNSRGVPG